MPIERIEAFVRGESSETFERLALEAFAFQFERIGAYRDLCERRGATPTGVAGWERIPMVPTLAFKSTELSAGEPVETFRSSGTTAVERSLHRHAFPDLYRATIETSFASFALPGGVDRLPILSFIPDRRLAPDSSLSFMIEHVLATWGDETSQTAVTARGVDVRASRAWLAARQREGRPVLLLATSLALIEALAGLERLGLRFRLPPGSLLFETGGYKGRSSEHSAGEIERRLETWLDIPRRRIVREYGMTELTSQLYSDSLAGGATDLFVAPPWVRVRVLDAESLEPVEAGAIGMVAIFDLANLSSAIHLLTEDLGALEPGGLRLHGRAEGAELRGCSLTAEELATPPGGR